MSKRVAQFIFNPVFSEFIEEYNRAYGEYTPHLRNKVLPSFRSIYSVYQHTFTGKNLIVKNRRILHSLTNGVHVLDISPKGECFIDGHDYRVNGEIVKVNPEDIKFLQQEHKSEPKNYDNIDKYMCLMLQSFCDPKMVDLLNEKNEILITDMNWYTKCPLFQHFQLHLIWNKTIEHQDSDDEDGNTCEQVPLLNAEEKENIFQYWLGCYCIAKSINIIPDKVLNAIEREALANSKTVATSKSLNLGSMKRTGQEIIQELKPDHIFQLYEYITECCLAPYTPLYTLVPDKYHPMINNIRDMWKDEKIRLVIADQIKPILEDIKKSQKIQGIMVIDDEDESESGNNNISNNGEGDEQHEKQRGHAISYFLDLCLGVVERNQDLINNSMKNPGSIKEFISNAGSIGNIVQKVSKEFKEVIKITDGKKYDEESTNTPQIQGLKINNSTNTPTTTNVQRPQQQRPANQPQFNNQYFQPKNTSQLFIPEEDNYFENDY